MPDTGDAGESPAPEEPSEETSGEAGTEQPGEETTGGEQSTVDDGAAVGDSDALTLLAQAEELFAQAEELLRAGDLGGYQETIRLAEDKVNEAIDALEG